MADKPDPATRAGQLRQRIAKRKTRTHEPSVEPDSNSQPRPGESPNAYVERRMRETLKKKKELP